LAGGGRRLPYIIHADVGGVLGQLEVEGLDEVEVTKVEVALKHAHLEREPDGEGPGDRVLGAGARVGMPLLAQRQGDGAPARIARDALLNVRSADRDLHDAWASYGAAGR
jgi:hypothetical protein